MGFSHIIFDWGDTLMRDFPEKSGPMADWDVITVITGVIETLKILKNKYTLVVATNAGVSDTELMRQALRRGNIEHFFTHFYSSKDLGYAKPDVNFFLEICKQMNVIPEQCVFVGNDYIKDIEGASVAGMNTIFFNHAEAKPETPAAFQIISKFDELLNILLP